ncbi:hypothetical protein HYR54_14335 [Candidatus Acetothermia bacterium]|nr:hypothetical protein [Candidatus Acetothermia bacterium]
MDRRIFLKGVGFFSVTALAGSLVGCKHEKTSLGKTPIVALGGPKGELAFFPDRLRIQPGQTVTFVLQSGGHSATAYHPKNNNRYQTRIPEGTEPWDTDLLVEKGTHFSWAFQTEGVYNYFCRPHESIGMVGVIVVGRALDGPGLSPPQTELPPLAQQKLKELISWAKGP